MLSLQRAMVDLFPSAPLAASNSLSALRPLSTLTFLVIQVKPPLPSLPLLVWAAVSLAKLSLQVLVLVIFLFPLFIFGEKKLSVSL